MEKLEKIRRKINTLDREIVKILKKRIALAVRTLKYKEAPYDPFREKDILSRVPTSIKPIFRELISVCRNSEKQMKVFVRDENALLCGLYFLGSTTIFAKKDRGECFRKAGKENSFVLVEFSGREVEEVDKHNLFVWVRFCFRGKKFILAGRRYNPHKLLYPLFVLLRGRVKGRTMKGREHFYTEIEVKNPAEYKAILKRYDKITGIYPEERDD